MDRFAQLHRQIDEAKSAAEREAALAAYFRAAPAADAAWALALLAGPRPRRAATPAQLLEWAAEAAAMPGWLVEESRQAVGDFAETVAHLLDGIEGDRREWPLHRLVEERLLPLARAGAEAKRATVVATWRELAPEQRFVWNRLLAGTFRPRVTPEVVARAFAVAMGGDAAAVERRLAQPWWPSEAALRELCSSSVAMVDAPAERSARAAVDVAKPGDPTEAEHGTEAAGVTEANDVTNADSVTAHRVVAVLLYAQRGEGPRSTHYCDFTFALWHDGELVPIAKVSADVASADVAELDRWVRRNAVERFGPVRQLRPELVFELAFDGVEASGRRKAGLTLRAPRILRWLRGGNAAEAGSLRALHDLLDQS
ncbi:MAG TPA: hypothetical protein VN923_18605 [Thermoanaerobaculia bacterium]|nr:hypothetical protein [Thermoanaerobaculia bacterium]